jgi:hypothetical protein
LNLRFNKVKSKLDKAIHFAYINLANLISITVEISQKVQIQMTTYMMNKYLHKTDSGKTLLNCLSIILLTVVISCTSSCDNNGHSGLIELKDNIPEIFHDYISKIQIDSLGEYQPEIKVQEISANLILVNVRYSLKDTLRQNDWRITIHPGFQPDFHWTPHLTPTDEHIISQHVFRAPAMIISEGRKQLVVIPDLDIMKKGSPVKWYMDLDAPANRLTLGTSNYKVREHVLFIRDTGAVFPPGIFEYGFYIMANQDEESSFNPWEKPVNFFWEQWGEHMYLKGQPISASLESYIEHTYNWAFTTWKDAVWQEFILNKKKVGAPVFIVNFTQSPNYPGKVNEREFRSIWNQAWFSSLRSAQGVYRYARRVNNQSLIDKANMTKELALSFPQRNGFFPGVIATEMEKLQIDGNIYNRSKGWETYFYGNSNRNPENPWGNAKGAPYHILDMSWTAYLMLTWYEELEDDNRLMQYASSYANSLLNFQDDEGFFPAWLSFDTMEPFDELKRSPETSMTVTFLLKLYELTNEKKYFEAAVRAMNAVMEEVIPDGRWEDFETYWSCSRFGEDHLNMKFERNNMYKQNSFSIFWTAEALYNTYKITGDKNYLNFGKRTLDELLMMQAAWQPPYMYVNTLGGMGVMNADGEWNDSRQSLFAELIIKYGLEFENEAYIQRGIAALKASFVMMYCPENPKTKALWEEKYEFFNDKDYGFMMENYGHNGYTNPEGIGIGPFTIYDWGNGAASEAYNRIIDHFGEKFISEH